MSDAGKRFYIRHIRAGRVCMSGARMYFEERGWDWNDFLSNGRLISDLDIQNDKYAAMVADLALKEK